MFWTSANCTSMSLVRLWPYAICMHFLWKSAYLMTSDCCQVIIKLIVSGGRSSMVVEKSKNASDKCTYLSMALMMYIKFSGVCCEKSIGK